MPSLYGYDLTGRKDNPLIQVPITVGAKHDPLLAQWQAGLGKVAVYTGDAFNRWDANWVGTGMYEKFWSQVVRGVSRSPFSSDFETEMTTDGDKGHIIVHAEKEGNAFNNFLNIAGTVAGGADLTPHPIRLVQTGPGTYEADFDASAQGSYLCYLTYAGQDRKSGSLLAGTTVNSSPEMRDLQSNDALLKQIAQRTGGRLLKPFDVSSADLFTRDGLTITDSPQSIWDLLVPWLLALIILDVAVRRIAWDWPATKRLAAGGGGLRPTVHDDISPGGKSANAGQPQARARGGGRAEIQKCRRNIPATPGPIHARKFEAGEGVAGDITAVVGGAVDKPIPAAPGKSTRKARSALANIQAGCSRPNGGRSRKSSNSRNRTEMKNSNSEIRISTFPSLHQRI